MGTNRLAAVGQPPPPSTVSRSYPCTLFPPRGSSVRNWLPCFVVSLLVVASSVPQAWADVSLPKVFSSHMVFQRERPLPIWGRADPGEEVTVKLDEATATTKADAKGGWKVVLPAVKADGKAHRMTIAGKNKIELADILIGEVWLGSGQSNMDFPLVGARNGKAAVAKADYPQIRLLHVARVQKPQPAGDIVLWSPKQTNRSRPWSTQLHRLAGVFTASGGIFRGPVVLLWRAAASRNSRCPSA